MSALARRSAIAPQAGFYMLHNTLQTNRCCRWRPSSRAFHVALRLALFSGQSAGVALAAPVMDRYGGQPIFLLASVIILATPLVPSAARGAHAQARLKRNGKLACPISAS
jgi:hypothetical protein